MRHAVRWDDFQEGAQVCNTSQSCQELDLSHTHACTCEECHRVRNTDKTEKNVRATRCSAFTPVHEYTTRKCLEFLQHWKISLLTKKMFKGLHRNRTDIFFEQFPFRSLLSPLLLSSFRSFLLCSPCPFPLFFSSFFSPSSLNQLVKKMSSCIALYSPVMSPSSSSSAPLSRSTFSLTRFHNPFCAMKPSLSNLFRSL